jgi:hypothetical protein
MAYPTGSHKGPTKAKEMTEYQIMIYELTPNLALINTKIAKMRKDRWHMVNSFVTSKDDLVVIWARQFTG